MGIRDMDAKPKNANTQNGDVFFNFGLLLRDHLGDAVRALKQFERVLALNAEDAEAKEEYEFTLRVLRKSERDLSDSEHEQQPMPSPQQTPIIDEEKAMDKSEVQSLSVSLSKD